MFIESVHFETTYGVTKSAEYNGNLEYDLDLATCIILPQDKILAT